MGFEAVLRGELLLMPNPERLSGIKKDHQTAIDGCMFYSTPDTFDVIVDRLQTVQEKINQVYKKANR